MKDGKGNRAIRNEICEVIMGKERVREREKEENRRRRKDRKKGDTLFTERDWRERE